ncbi:hexameric tyrosine-coordinated heme protein [Algiphilus aromaticivorans]|uniref:hexameric tyrosine-coordinated heme protein n=1 Tax=Algiphilus aromaticivorans TaxID=382454 RepID=UPI0012EBA7EA|nr:hexameric tyrosine-coordinated heme protein [Algiphilus aromaticivorans]
MATGLLAAALSLAAPAVASAEPADGAGQSWLPSLVTDTPEEGFALAVKLSQKGVAKTQPDADVRKTLRPKYARDADSLISASQVIATHFRTIAEANDYWR